jgi:hypothetical protein
MSENEKRGIGGIGARYQVKRDGYVVAEADDPMTARARANQEKRLHTNQHVSMRDQLDEPID